MTSPANGSSSVTFNRTAGTGTTPSQAVTTLPTNGSAVQVRLWSLIGGSWGFNTYNYTASGP